MKEYNRHVSEYLNYPYASFSSLIPYEKWGNKLLAKTYLDKYWLSEQEYINDWKQVQNDIFYPHVSLPELVFRTEFAITAAIGGCLFTEKSFKQIQNAMLDVGEEQFVIIQHSQEFTEGQPMFRMKFPTTISWNELMSGNYISAVLFEMGYNEYYIFGKSGNWGKYSASDYEFPLDIIGYRPDFTSVFEKHFEQSQFEIDQTRIWLPERYKQLVR